MYYIYILSSQLLKLKHCFVNQHQTLDTLNCLPEVTLKIFNKLCIISDAELCYNAGVINIDKVILKDVQLVSEGLCSHIKEVTYLLYWDSQTLFHPSQLVRPTD